MAQVLSRDIRSVTQRIKVPRRAQHGGPAALCTSSERTQQQQQQGEASTGGAAAVAAAAVQEEGYWKVVLDGIQISYDVEEGSSDVVLRSACLPPQ